MFEKAKRMRRHFKVALFGRWKTGKTRAALSFPKPAVIDTHRGTDLYDEKYNFHVLHCNRWKDIGKPIHWLKGNATKEGFQTLVIDDISVLYSDLINEITEWRQNKSGSMAPLNPGDWGVIKRRWRGFMNVLVELDLNVVLVVREKEEYEETTDREGRETRKKTGGFLLDADKQTSYVFDFILYCSTSDDRKKQESKHFIRVEGTRHKRVPLYSVHDITDKYLYPLLFEPIEKLVTEGEPIQTDRPNNEPEKTETKKGGRKKKGEKAESKEEPLGDPKSVAERTGDMLDKFVSAPNADDPHATLEDVKVLMTRANQLEWPDGSKFTSEQGRTMITALYRVESTKELRKPQVDFLYEAFGEVLTGRSYLALDEKGIPYIARRAGRDGETARQEVTSNTEF